MPEALSPNSSGNLTPPSAKTADDINDFFNSIDSDDDVKPGGKAKDEPKDTRDKVDDKIKTRRDKDEDDETDSDINEIKLIDHEDDDDEKLDLDSASKDADDVVIDAPPRLKDILKKYPELIKDYPFIGKVLARDKQYTELFGSLDDAKEIAEKAEIFNEFEVQLLSGKTEDILKNVKETDSKAFDKIVDDYLPSLARVDKEAYFHVVNNIGKHIIMGMVAEAKESGSDELQEAALLLNRFLFSTDKFTPPKNRIEKSANAEGDEAKNEAEAERLSYVKERFETSRDELQVRVDNILKSTINEYIDPRGTMSPYVKKNAIRDALSILNSSISADTGFKKNLDKVWRVAFDSKFSKESLGKIQSLYLGRAKSSLPLAIKKARAEALKDSAPQDRFDSKDDKDDKEEKSEREPKLVRRTNAGRPAQQKTNKMEKGESVADFFARD